MSPVQLRHTPLIISTVKRRYFCAGCTTNMNPSLGVVINRLTHAKMPGSAFRPVAARRHNYSFQEIDHKRTELKAPRAKSRLATNHSRATFRPTTNHPASSRADSTRMQAWSNHACNSDQV